MKKRWTGFTLIEVSLFLAITGLLFVGIAIGTQNSISQQRSYDSVQNFAEFLRSVYSEVSNPQSVGDGRSNTAIYGKLISFGESFDMSGNNNDREMIFVYDVVGEVANGLGSGDIIEALKKMKANVVVASSTGNDTAIPAGVVENYMPKWQAEVENVDSSDNFKGAVLIVRHPGSGTINTLTSVNTIEVNKWVYVENRRASAISDLFQNQLDSFSVRDTDFCLNTSGKAISDKRTDIRIVSNAHNASGVEIIGLDDDSANGNRCRDW